MPRPAKPKPPAGTLVLEFGNRDDMAMRLALSSTVNAIMSTAGPLAGGLVAASLGYPPLLWASTGFLGAGLLVLLFKVREPRTRFRL